jgi:DNA-binding SARP family transcriptional activator/WD40 repeat protein
VAQLEFLVLGPLEVRHAGERLKLGGERQHALLTFLLLHANEVVPSELILAELYGNGTREPGNALQAGISRLRRVLPDNVLETRSRGYLLRTDPDQLDAAIFERRLEAGRRLLAAGDARGAAGELEAALALWRGSPLPELALFDFAQPQIRRLEELRLAAAMERTDAVLALGGGSDVVAELELLVAENPLQERLRGQLMLALYRSGRQAEALEAYRVTRELLLRELGLEPSRALQRLERAILNQDASLELADRVQPRSPICPFKGLAPYDRDDAEFFCGRERAVAELVARLAAGRFVGIVGSSGSGKSSLLRAGLLPALAGGALPGSAGWSVTVVRPGEPIDPEAQLVAVDQLEEAFTSLDDGGRASFLAAIAAATGHARVVVCLRADFYGRCAEHRELARLLSSSHVLIGPMEPDEVARAIEVPAARAGLEVEPSLVTALVAEVGDEPGSLPLLSTTLLELWRLRGDDVLRHETYRAAGGLHGAVARLAEQTYARLASSERETARRILLRLADGDARRRTPLDELDEADGPVLATLVDARLLTVDEGFVEVAHEALLREWTRLRDWLDEDVEGRRLHRDLAGSAADWQARGRDPAGLYRGPRLALALAWAAGNDGELSETEHAFLAASRRAAQRELRRLRVVAAALATLLVLAVAAGAVAVVQRQSARHDARVALAARVGAQAVAEPRLDRALLLAREAVRLDDSRQTEDALVATLLRSPAALQTFVLPGTVRPYRVTVSPDGRALAVGDSDGAIRFFDTRTERERGGPFTGAFGYGPAAYTADGSALVALANPPRALEVFDSRTLRRKRLLLLDPHFFGGDTGAVSPLALAGDAVFFAYDRVIDPQNAEGPAFLDRWSIDSGERRTVALGSPDVVGAGVIDGGAKLVTVTSRAVETWDSTTLQRLSVLRLPLTLGGYAAVDPRGRHAVAIGHAANTIVFIDLRSGRVLPAHGAHAGGGALSVGFAPDGHAAVTTGGDGKAILWDPATGIPLETFTGHSGAVNSAAFSPDGRTLYASSLNGTIVAWDVGASRRFGVPFVVPPQPHELPNLPQTPPLAAGRDGFVVRDGTGLDVCSFRTTACSPVAGSQGALVSALSGSGGLVAVGRRGGVVELWRGGRRRRLVGLASTVQGVAVAGDLVAAADRRTLEVWQAGSGAAAAPPVALPAQATAVALAADGRRVAVGLQDGRVLVAGPGDARLFLRPRGAPNVSVAFAPDGTLLTGSFDGAIERWDGARRVGAAPSVSAGPVAAISVAADGTFFTTSSLTDGSVRVWTLRTLQPEARFPGDPFVLTNAALLPGDQRVVAVSENGKAVVWPLALASWEARACRVAARNLTRAEWQQFLPSVAYRPTCP